MNPLHPSELVSLIVLAAALAMATAMWMWQTEWGQSSIVFYGVRVPERFEDSLEAMPIRRQYENTVKLIPVVLLAMYWLVIHLTHVPPLLQTSSIYLCVLLLQGLGVRAAYWIARNETLPFAAAPETSRSASFVEMAGPGTAWQVFYWSAVLLPVPVLLGLAGYTWTHWLALHYPVVTNLQLPLTADTHELTWKRAAVFVQMRWLIHALVANAIAILVAFAFNFRSRINEWGEEETDRQSYRRQLMLFAVVMQWIVVVNCFMLLLVDWMRQVTESRMTAMIASGAYNPGHMLLTITLPLLAVGVAEAALPLWLMYRLYENRPPGFVNKSDDQHWKFGLYYLNPNDSAAVVPTRFGVGESFNLAHPLVWGIGVLSVALLALRYVPVLKPVHTTMADFRAESAAREQSQMLGDAAALKQGEFAASERLVYQARHTSDNDLKSSIAVVLAENHVKPTASAELAIAAASIAESRTRDSSTAVADEVPHLAQLWKNAGFVCLQQKHRTDGCAARYLAAAESLDPRPGYADLLAQANAADPAHAVQPMPAQVNLHLAAAPAGDTALRIVLVNRPADSLLLLQQIAARQQAAHPGAPPNRIVSIRYWADPGVTAADGSALDPRTAKAVLDAVSFPWPDKSSIGMRLRGDLHCATGGNCTLALQPESMRVR